MRPAPRPETWPPWQRLAADPLSFMAPDWAAAMSTVEPQLRALGGFLRREHDGGTGFLPGPAKVLRAFSRPLAEVKVLITGQDPYPTPGHAVGLSFSVDPATRPLPRSLSNIYKEMQADLGIAPAPHGDLCGLGGAGRAAAQPGADRLPGRRRIAPGQGLGGRSRRPPSPPWRRGTSRWWPSSGATTPSNCAPMLGGNGHRGVRPSQPAVGLARLLRLAPLQPDQ